MAGHTWAQKLLGKNALWYRGFLGFLGFRGFRYFPTGEAKWLFWFGFFAFFANFWIAKIALSIPDERYQENTKLAKAFVGDLALLEMSLLFVLGVFWPQRIFLILGIALVWASLMIAYAVKLYFLEEK